MTEQDVLWLDSETWSLLDIRKVGTARYVEHAEPMIFTWAVGDEPVQTWDMMSPHDVAIESKEHLAYDISRTSVIRAANAPFDREILNKVIPGTNDPDMWDCVQARARRAGWPQVSLDYLGKQLGLPEDQAKIKDGKRLIKMFCCPRKPTKNIPQTRYLPEDKPGEWLNFLEYARIDVEALREIWKRLPGMNDSAFERKMWVVDQQINMRGWPVDMPSVIHANKLIEEEKRNIDARLCEMTRGHISGVSKVAQTIEYMGQLGYTVEDWTAETVNQIINNPTVSDFAKAIAQCRHEGSRATNSKYAALLNCTSDDHRLRMSLIYGAAARTLRWSGKAFQPHNLIRPIPPYDARLVASMLEQQVPLEFLRTTFADATPLEILAYGIRGVIQAGPGKHLVRGDLGQIEARGVNWLAGGTRMLKAFRDHDADPSTDDPYTVSAHDVGSDDRKLGKFNVLSCGYGIWAQAYIDKANAAPNYMGFTLEQGKKNILNWREVNPEVVQFWDDLGEACAASVESCSQQVCRRLQIQTWDFCGVRYMGIQLPSERWLCFPNAKVVKGKWNYKKKKHDSTITFTDEKGTGYTYGAALTGLVTQSMCRDIMAHGLLLLDAHGFSTIGHIHDEPISEEADDDEYHTPELMHQCLTTAPSWADNFPLAADCSTTKRYAKL